MIERIRARVVVSDVDSTQVIPGKLPSPAVRAAARGLRRNGVYLSEATSRTYSQITDLRRPLSLGHNLCTLDNGATIAHADTGEVLWSHWLKAESVGNVVERIGDLCTRICFDDDLKGYDPEAARSGISSGALIIGDRPTVFGVFRVEAGDEIVATLNKTPGVGHTPIMDYKGSETLRCIQVLNPGVDKRTGVERMLHYAGLSEAEAWAIGDGTNDFALFEAVEAMGGTKIAMGNAPGELKKAADWVAPSVYKDGFAVAMEHYGLLS